MRGRGRGRVRSCLRAFWNRFGARRAWEVVYPRTVKKHLLSAFGSSLRWGMLLIAFAVVGPLASLPLNAVRDVDGGHAISMFVNAGVFPGVIGAACVFAAALALGAIGAFLFSTGWACAYSGIVIAWGAYRCGTLEEIIRQARSDAPLTMLASEGLTAILFAGLIAGVIQRISAKRQGLAVMPGSLIIQGDVPNLKTVTQIALAAGGVAAGVVAYLAAVTDFKGQGIFAAFFAAIIAGVATQIVAKSKGGQATVVLVVASVVIPAILGPAAAKILQGSTIVETVFAGRVIPLARVMGLDWAAGALLGAPVGLGWAGAMIDSRAEEQAQSA